MIGIIDYGMGNLRSVQKALQRVAPDSTVRVIDQPAQIGDCDKVILPGVGAFGDAMKHLHERGLTQPVLDYVDSGRPFLGICLGLQLLFETSTEEGEHEGLGVLAGRVVRFELDDPTLKVPHMGWNALRFEQADNPLFAGLADGVHVYFVHGYHAEPTDASVTAATADYGGPFCASVHRANVWATQFHPEKSQAVGLAMLKNFAALT